MIQQIIAAFLCTDLLCLVCPPGGGTPTLETIAYRDEKTNIAATDYSA